MFHWEALNIHYTGLDIVAELVEKLSRDYPGRRFQCLDLVTQVPPRADLIFCRDCLVHLPLAEIQSAIPGEFRKEQRHLAGDHHFPENHRECGCALERLAAVESAISAPEFSRTDATVRGRLHRR